MTKLSDEAVAVLAARPEIIDIHDVRRLLDDAVALAIEVQGWRARRARTVAALKALGCEIEAQVPAPVDEDPVADEMPVAWPV